MTSISFDPKVNNTTSVSTSSKAENRGNTDIIKTSNSLYSDKVETGSSQDSCDMEIDGDFRKAKGEVNGKEFSYEMKTGLTWGLGNIKKINMDFDGNETELKMKKKGFFGGNLNLSGTTGSQDVDLDIKNKSNKVSIDGTFGADQINLSFDEDGKVTGLINGKEVSIKIDNELGSDFGDIDTDGDFNGAEEFMPILSMLYHTKKMDDWNPEAWG